MIKTTAKESGKDAISQKAAAIAYYTIFSIPPLLIITLAIAGEFYKPDTTRTKLLAELGAVIGGSAANFIGSLLENSANSPNSLLVSIIGAVLLFFGASGVFSQVQVALNTIWDVPRRIRYGILDLLKNRFLAFIMVLAMEFLFLAFLTISAVTSVFFTFLNGNSQTTWLPGLVNFFILWILLTLLIALVYRVIPDKEISWANVWLGAVVTGLLFMIGKNAIGLYLSLTNFGSAYGAAGSILVVLIWIYYSAQIFLLGAEFTRVYSRKFGLRNKNYL